MEERLKLADGGSRSKRDRDSDDKDIDMDGFMIVDSVGDVDGKNLNVTNNLFWGCQ